jgi:hypothetical protein
MTAVLLVCVGCVSFVAGAWLVAWALNDEVRDLQGELLAAHDALDRARRTRR